MSSSNYRSWLPTLHRPTTRRLPCLVFAFATLLLAQRGQAAPVNFAREILPILSNKCFVCHGPDGTAKDVLRLDSYEAATRVLDSGNRGIDPDEPENSQVLTRVHSEDAPMPPADAEKQLTASEKELIVRWIREGGTYARHWAFVAPEKPSPPGDGSAKGSRAVDAFVEAKLKARGLSPAPPADRATLARRAALVLTGLPPEPAQLEAFLGDESEQAYERLVDQLLQSPRYGEHQARYWLDAVRYGDTHGLHLDNRRGIFPYRDWVVHALNRNLPLDDFLTWQLAGDLLSDPTLEQLVATGFVRMNPTTAEGGVIPDEFQAKNNFDRTETLGTVFLGMSLTCARCHSHKYDPISQTEYYRLLAFFNSTAESPLDGNKYEYGPVAKAPASVEAWSRWTRWQGEMDTLLAGAGEWVEKLPPAEAERWRAANRDERLRWLAEGDQAPAELQTAAREIVERLKGLEADFTTTLVARELPAPRVTKLLRRGEYNLPEGQPLQPGVPLVMGDLPEDARRDRLGLARWLTSRDHPLVARVLVNRIWQRVFGEGLVRSPEDFGLQGEQPTHPELLDWLAVELHDSGWDLKHMLRLMVRSRTFRQSSEWRQEVEDPENRLLARGPRFRLDAEVLRDIGLWAGGLLAAERGGEGIKPYQPPGLWAALMHPASNTKKYVPDTGSRLYRRSLYVYWKRTSPHPMLTLFDAPSREVSCVRRSRTNTPLQSLGLLNETQRIEMGRSLAERLLQERESDAARLELLFTLLASRPPNDVERAACEELLAAMRGRFAAAPEDARALLAQGEAGRDERLDAAEHAAWTQLAVTVLASDVAILLY